MTISPIIFNKQVSLTWEEFDNQFKVMSNHLSKDENLQMFETYDDELEYVKTIPDNRVWTYVDTDGGSATYNGFHYVNRIGYFITELPAEDDTDYEIDLQIDTCDNCEGPFGDFQHDNGLCDDCCEGCEQDDN